MGKIRWTEKASNNLQAIHNYIARDNASRMNPLLQPISIDPDVCFGRLYIRGTRIWVSLILDFLANGMDIKEILAEYPQLTEEDVRAAIAKGEGMKIKIFLVRPNKDFRAIRVGNKLFNRSSTRISELKSGTLQRRKRPGEIFGTSFPMSKNRETGVRRS